MKPYGLRVIEYPDVADIQMMGAKGRCGKFPSKCGKYRGYCWGESKAATRRYWKRKARVFNKEEISNAINDHEVNI